MYLGSISISEIIFSTLAVNITFERGVRVTDGNFGTLSTPLLESRRKNKDT